MLGSERGPDLLKMPILAKKKIIQAKLLHLGHRKPARIHCKADTPKMSNCLVRILFQRHNWAISLRKRARRGRYSQWQLLSGHDERIFVHKHWRGGYWQYLVSTGQLDYYLLGAAKNKCYADKPDTIDALKDNVREAIGEIQLHTIANVLKNWTNRVGCCTASRSSHLNEIIFQY